MPDLTVINPSGSIWVALTGIYVIMTDAINFRKDVLDRLAGLKKRYSVSDKKVTGLKLMVYPTGGKTYILYRKVNGKPQRIKIGRYTDLTIEQARKQATTLNAIIALGGSPHEDKKAKRDQLTFKQLYDAYYNEHALKFTKRPDDNKKMMEFHIFPKHGNKKGNELTPVFFKKLHSEIGDKRGKGTANRVMTIVSAVYNFCIKNDYYSGTNPCFMIKKFKLSSRDRFLTREELKLFFEALQSEADLFKHLFLLLLYTGARKSNVLSMKWSDINFDLKRWRIPESHSKNKDVNIVLLSEPALEILKERSQANNALNNPSLFVFPGDSKDGHLIDPKKAFARIKKHMNVADFRIHDLRRTFGSYMAISGASLPIIGKALNHKSHASTEIYARLSHDPILEAVNVAALVMTK